MMNLRQIAQRLAQSPTTRNIREALEEIDRYSARPHYVRSAAYALLRLAKLPPSNFFLCFECGLPTHIIDSRNSVFVNDGQVCASCHSDLYDDGEHIYDRGSNMPAGLRSYDTDVLNYFSPAWTRLDGNSWENLLLLGVELEAETRENYPHDIVRQIENSLNNFAIVKSDGSLDDGVEIVTVPATIAAHKSGVWSEFMKGPAKHLKGWSTSTAGMHIHINRRALSLLTLSRMLTFINSPENSRLLFTVAGRGSVHYSQYKQSVGLTSLLRGYPDGKYNALNIEPRNTVELRIFRSNITLHGVYRNLEFAHALVRFCAQTSNKNLSTSNFIDWINRNPKDYENMLAMLHGHSYAVTKPKSKKLLIEGNR